MFTVRVASTSDAEALAALVRAQMVIQEEFEPTLAARPEMDWNAYALERIHRKNGVVLVTETAGQLIGYADIGVMHEGFESSGWRRLLRRLRTLVRRSSDASIFLPRRYGFIYDIYVSKAHRASMAGVGTKLMRSSLDWFAARQVACIECYVTETNAVAIDFFAHMGFKTIRRRMRTVQSTGN